MCVASGSGATHFRKCVAPDGSHGGMVFQYYYSDLRIPCKKSYQNRVLNNLLINTNPYKIIAKLPYRYYPSFVTAQEQSSFEWDVEKDRLNQEKHGVSFVVAQYAFGDPRRIILEDSTHSTEVENRYFASDKWIKAS